MKPTRVLWARPVGPSLAALALAIALFAPVPAQADGWSVSVGARYEHTPGRHSVGLGVRDYRWSQERVFAGLGFDARMLLDANGAPSGAGMRALVHLGAFGCAGMFVFEAGAGPLVEHATPGLALHGGIFFSILVVEVGYVAELRAMARRDEPFELLHQVALRLHVPVALH